MRAQVNGSVIFQIPAVRNNRATAKAAMWPTLDFQAGIMFAILADYGFSFAALVNEPAASDRVVDARKCADIGCRVAIEHHQVRQFSRRDGSFECRDAETRGRRDGEHPQHVAIIQARFGERFKFIAGGIIASYSRRRCRR